MTAGDLMPTSLVLALLGVVVVLVALRLALPGLPMARLARPVRAADAALAIVAMIGLVLHCGAMFFRDVVAAIPGSGAYIAAVNGMGTASIIAYVIPAVLLLVGLRRQVPPALAVLALALIMVGITMYDGGALTVHLAAITAAVVVIALIITILTTRSGRTPRPDLTHRPRTAA